MLTKTMISEKKFKERACYRKLSNEEFEKLVLDHFYYYSVILNDCEKFRKFGIQITDDFKERFVRMFHIISPPTSNRETYTYLDCSIRSVKIIPASIMYIILQTDYDIDDNDLTRREFAKILGFSEGHLNNYIRYYIRNYFDINTSEYYKKIVSYYEILIETLDNSYNLSLTRTFKDTVLKNKVIQLIDYLVHKRIEIPESIFASLSSNEKEICRILENHGFDIQLLFKTNKYHFFMPQIVASVFIYFFKDLKEIKQKRDLNLFTLYQVFDLSLSKMRRLFNILKFPLQQAKLLKLPLLHHYPRAYFIKDLEKELKRAYNLDLDLIYKLYNLMSIDPEEFTKKVIDYQSIRGGHKLIYYLKHKSMTGIMFKRIKKNLTKLHEENLISHSILRKARTIINKVIYLKSVSLKHGSIVYNFRFNEKNLKRLNDTQLKDRLNKHFKNIIRGKYPKHLFDDPHVPSGSMLYLKGNKGECLLTEVIRRKLIKPLQISQKLKKYNSGLIYSLTFLANRSYTEYITKFGIKPKHDPILSSLIRNRNVLSIETPIWKKLSNHSYFVGHIDLLAVFNGIFIIADYKPKESEIFRSIPQICAYAYMFKQRLGLKDFKNILCVIFNKDVVYSFNPEILENEILQFVKNEDYRRKISLKCKKMKNGVETDLRETIEELIK